MKVVATFHPPSSVSHSLSARLSPDHPATEYLVVAKLNRLDVYSIQPDGLKWECTSDVWGVILSVKAIPIPDTKLSNLLLLTDHPDPDLIFLEYVNSASPRLKATHHISLAEISQRPAEFFNDVVLDEDGAYAVVGVYTGKLKVVVFEHGNYHKDFDVPLISELTLLSLCFLSSPSSSDPLLAILHVDHYARTQLLSRSLLIERDKKKHILDVSISSTTSPALLSTCLSKKLFPFVDENPPRLIPVDDGVLVVGGRKILLFEFAPRRKQDKAKGKQTRLEAKKASANVEETAAAREKEREREGRERKADYVVEWPWGDLVAWCQVKKGSRRYLLGDAFGRLAMLSLEELDSHGIILLPLGQSSPPTTLTYLTSQITYLGSHFGPSHLLRLSTSPASLVSEPTLPIPDDVKTIAPNALLLGSKGKNKEGSERDSEKKSGWVLATKGRYFEEIETWKNLAPIVDGICVDTDGSGQVPPIFTCSGGRNTGSINVVRKGADFEELAVIEGIEHVTAIWATRQLYDDSTDMHLVLSTLTQTLLFRLDTASRVSFVETIRSGVVTEFPSIAISNIPKRLPKSSIRPSYPPAYANSSYLIQITRKGVGLLEYEMGLGDYAIIGDPWTSDELGEGWKGMDIVCADVSVTCGVVVVALTAARLVLLELGEGDAPRFNVLKHANLCDSTGNSREISAVSHSPSNSQSTQYILVSFWGSNRIDIFTASLQKICSTPSLPALPRSVLLYHFSPAAKPYFFAGLSNGTIVSFIFDGKQLSEQKIMNLGDAPISSLTACDVYGKRGLVACGSRVAILYMDKERLCQSPVLLKNVVTAAAFNTREYPNCLIMATATGLLIGRVRDLDKMHIRSFSLGLDNPRHIRHDSTLKAFGVGCHRTEPVRVGDPEVLTSSFKLLDDTTFQTLAQWRCDADEDVTAVETLSHDVDGGSVSYFCIGTVYNQPDEMEPTKGRLLVFGGQVQASGVQLILVASEVVQGCIYALASLRGNIAAAINASVSLFSLHRDDHRTTLRKGPQWNHNYIVTSLVSYGDNLVLGDAISSVSLLKLEATQLRTLARDYGPLWPVCVQALDEQSIIGANVDCNIFTFTLQRSEISTLLERNGSYHMADVISKFLPGTLTAPDASKEICLTPKQLFCTSSGRIGVVIDVGDDLSIHLTSLQRNMASVITGLGGLNHTKYRAPRNSRGRSDAERSSFGFVDGDFLEQYLTSSNGILKQIQRGQNEAEQLKMSPEKIRKTLEALQSMH